MATGKKPRTFRLSKEAEDSISAVAERDGVSATEVVERAVISYASGPHGGDARSDAPGAAIEALTAQLGAKDAQIAAALGVSKTTVNKWLRRG